MEHSTIFICYTTCVDDVELGVGTITGLRGGTQYNIHSLCNLYKRRQLVQIRSETQHNIHLYATCADEGRNTVQYSFVMQLMQMTLNLFRGEVEHSTIFSYATCADEGWNTVQYSLAMQLVQIRLIHAVELRVQC